MDASQMDYNWNGARLHRKKVVKFGATVAFAGLLIAVATQVVFKTL